MITVDGPPIHVGRPPAQQGHQAQSVLVSGERLSRRPRPTPTEFSYDSPLEAGDETFAAARPILTSALVHNARTPLDEVIEEIRALASPGAPDEISAHPLAVESAVALIEAFYNDAMDAGQRWHEPLVGTDDAGNIILQWWRAERKVSLYVGSDSTEYIKVWGPSILHEMEDGKIVTALERRALWQWLLDETVSII